MTNYNDGKWHPWSGGECPVHPESEVDVMFSYGTKHLEKVASKWDWSSEPGFPIVAFRVTKEHKEPREFWLYRDDGYDFQVKECPVRSHWDEVIHVREVIE